MPFTSTIILTGASSGLGEATALQLGQQAPQTRIVITSRSDNGVAASINAKTGHDNVVHIALDLSTHAGTRSFVNEFISRSYPPISALLLNAAIQYTNGVHMSKDGIEEMFEVTHVNHALLFFLLKDHLKEDARISIVASSTHDPAKKRIKPITYTSADEIAHPAIVEEKGMDEGLKRYALAKLANILFAYKLAEKAQAAGKQWVVSAFDPGVMATRLYREQGWFFNWVIAWLAPWLIAETYTAKVTAESYVKLAIGHEYGDAKTISGRYYRVLNVEPIKSSVESYDDAKQQDLWDWTIQQTAKGQEEAKAFENL